MQIPWLKSCLNASTATWDIVNGHYPLWGSDVSYGNPAPNSTKKSLYPGMCGAWGSVRHMPCCLGSPGCETCPPIQKADLCQKAAPTWFSVKSKATLQACKQLMFS